MTTEISGSRWRLQVVRSYRGGLLFFVGGVARELLGLQVAGSRPSSYVDALALCLDEGITYLRYEVFCRPPRWHVTQYTQDFSIRLCLFVRFRYRQFEPLLGEADRPAEAAPLLGGLGVGVAGHLEDLFGLGPLLGGVGDLLGEGVGKVVAFVPYVVEVRVERLLAAQAGEGGVAADLAQFRRAPALECSPPSASRPRGRGDGP